MPPCCSSSSSSGGGFLICLAAELRHLLQIDDLGGMHLRGGVLLVVIRAAGAAGALQRRLLRPLGRCRRRCRLAGAHGLKEGVLEQLARLGARGWVVAYAQADELTQLPVLDLVQAGRLDALLAGRGGGGGGRQQAAVQASRHAASELCRPVRKQHCDARQYGCRGPSVW